MIESMTMMYMMIWVIQTAVLNWLDRYLVVASSIPTQDDVERGVQCLRLVRESELNLNFDNKICTFRIVWFKLNLLIWATAIDTCRPESRDKEFNRLCAKGRSIFGGEGANILYKYVILSVARCGAGNRVSDYRH